jgi:hypothetical protein
MLPSGINDSEAGKYTDAFRQAGDRFLGLHEAESWILRGVESPRDGVFVHMSFLAVVGECRSLFR